MNDDLAIWEAQNKRIRELEAKLAYVKDGQAFKDFATLEAELAGAKAERDRLRGALIKARAAFVLSPCVCRPDYVCNRCLGESEVNEALAGEVSE